MPNGFGRGGGAGFSLRGVCWHRQGWLTTVRLLSQRCWGNSSPAVPAILLRGTLRSWLCPCCVSNGTRGGARLPQKPGGGYKGAA